MKMGLCRCAWCGCWIIVRLQQLPSGVQQVCAPGYGCQVREKS